jgi:hypothetical protein
MRQNKKLKVLQTINPCSMDWNEMIGNNKVRHCAKCDKVVYNISEMNAKEINRLFNNNATDLCGTYYRNSRGGISINNFERKLFKVKVRGLKAIGSLLTAIISIISPTYARNSQEWISIISGNHSFAVKTQYNSNSKPKLVGTIFDKTKAIIEQADILVINEDTNEEIKLTTNTGKFSLDLQPGSYSISAYSPGFVTFTEKHLKVMPESLIIVELSLEVGTSGGMALLEQ